MSAPRACTLQLVEIQPEEQRKRREMVIEQNKDTRKNSK